MHEVIFLYPEMGGLFEGIQQTAEHVCRTRDKRCINTASLDEVRTRVIGGAPIDRVIVVVGGQNISAEEAKEALSREHPETLVVTIQAPHWKSSADIVMVGSAVECLTKALEMPSSTPLPQD